jgi:hypothetical protein
MNLHDALARVSEMRARILESQKFRGYSGRARALGGCAALIGGLVVNLIPEGVRHVAIPAVWGMVFVVAFVLNYGAVLQWWLKLSKDERARSPLSPALENLPVFVVGGSLTVHLIAYGYPGALPGMWASVLALTQFTAKYAIPRGLRAVGWYYVAAGSAMLAYPEFGWDNPVVPGLVFFIGEWAGGWLIFRAHHAGGVLDFLVGKTPEATKAANP